MKEKIKRILENYENNKDFIKNSPETFAKVLRNELGVYICTRPEVYKNGINHIVQVITPDPSSPTLYNEKLCTGSYGDNAEFSSVEEAVFFGITKIIEKLYGEI